MTMILLAGIGNFSRKKERKKERKKDKHDEHVVVASSNKLSVNLN